MRSIISFKGAALAFLLIAATIFYINFQNLSAQEVAAGGSVSVVGAINPAMTNTDPDVQNIIAKVGEVKSIFDQWGVVVKGLKSGVFSFGYFALTMIPLFLITIMVLGVIIVMVLRAITYFTPDRIDKKIEPVEDWITKYMIKIPITILARVRGLKKKE